MSVRACDLTLRYAQNFRKDACKGVLQFPVCTVSIRPRSRCRIEAVVSHSDHRFRIVRDIRIALRLKQEDGCTP
jgi:hypothetical protein